MTRSSGLDSSTLLVIDIVPKRGVAAERSVDLDALSIELE